MRHFAKELKAEGWHIRYHVFQSESPDQFQHWAKRCQTLRMEYFYREMRQQTGYLMQGQQPVGQQWNFDRANRNAWSGHPPLAAPLHFERDQIDLDVLELIEREFSLHPGSLDDFCWATTRNNALHALQHFISHNLPHFGDYQDAMVQSADMLFHSLLSPYLNCGLLLHKEVCDAAEAAYHAGHAPLNAVEGFIRQILGWREYVRGIYWLYMPDYTSRNALQYSASLPQFYWTGRTRMNCMAQCFRNTFQHAYAHRSEERRVGKEWRSG